MLPSLTSPSESSAFAMRVMLAGLMSVRREISAREMGWHASSTPRMDSIFFCLI